MNNQGTAFSKCFPGAGYVKVRGSLCSEGTLSSALRVWACGRVLGYSSLEKKIEIYMLEDAMTGHLIC